jgi:amidase
MSGDVVDTTCDDALGDSDMTDLLHRLERREVNAAELRFAALRRAESANPSLNALTASIPEPRADSNGGGPLAGIPTVVKDNEALVGEVTAMGSMAVTPQPADHDAPFVSQLLELGLQPIGKTTMPEFGLTATTESTRHGATRNPWNTSRSTGGSSGGSAAMVAAGVVPIAHANDGGGSIRIPSSCCGLFGLKPSRGRLIDAPELARLPINIVTQGVVTRSVRDTARFFAEAERCYANPNLPPVGAVTSASSRRLRIAVVLDYDGRSVSPDTMAALGETTELLLGLGHSVDEVEFPFSRQDGRDFLRYWALMAYAMKNFGDQMFGVTMDAGRTERLTDGLSSLLTGMAERIPLSIWRLRRRAARPGAGLGSYDALLIPVLGHEPPPIGYLGPDVDFDTHLGRLLRYAGFTAMSNVSGAPSMSVPLGRSETGLPIGVQFVAPVGQERSLLELAYELEEARPWRRTPAA